MICDSASSVLQLYFNKDRMALWEIKLHFVIYIFITHLSIFWLISGALFVYVFFQIIGGIWVSFVGVLGVSLQRTSNVYFNSN
jgi:hypothetical protein